MKKLFLTFIFSCSMVVYVATQAQNSSSKDRLITQFEHLSTQQLLDTAEYYYNNNLNEIALVCYHLIINSSTANSDVEQQKKIAEAYNYAAIIYMQVSNYRTAYELLIKALTLCEKINQVSNEARIYSNIGGIYSDFKKYDLTKYYLLKALNICEDSIFMVAILNNLGDIELKNGNMDSAAYFLNQSLHISKQHNNIFLGGILTTIALLNQKQQLYDSALYYYRLALEVSKKNNNFEIETENLSSMAYLFFEINKIDSALYYIDLANSVAMENNFLRFLAENYLLLSKISESKGDIKKAFEYHKKYANLKDSIFNVKNFGDINQLQRLYEVTKTNQQIEQLAIERQIKERTIYYQKIIQYITLSILLLVSIALLFIYLQNRRLNRAYKVLFEKNVKIMNLQENSAKENLEKYRKSTLTHDMQAELMERILILMNDTSIICDPEFTIDKLAELVQSNKTYVSQVINTILKKNFRSFLNEYRIEEAQRLFSDPDTTKYTTEVVAFRVGFKSHTGFRNIFKDITGVSPAFYLKSLQKTVNS